MARRRRRRRSRRRRGSILTTPLIATGVLLLVATIAGGVLIAMNRGWSVSFGGGPASVSSSRFEGLGDLQIPLGPEPQFWWAVVSTETELVDPDYLTGVPEGLSFRRVIVPTDLLYRPDSAELGDNSSRALDEIARQITVSTLEVVVVCHSSPDGPASSRTPLSVRRAEMLATALESRLGRPKGSIRRIGKGDSVPLAGVDADTPTGRARLRRCEVFVEAT